MTMMIFLKFNDSDDHSDNDEIILPKRPAWQPASTHGPFTHPFIQGGQIANQLTPRYLRLFHIEIFAYFKRIEV